MRRRWSRFGFLLRSIGTTALVAALLLPGSLQVGQAGAAQLDPQAQQLPADSGPAGEAAPPAGGPREGIQVHGAWTIAIYNPDGSLASRTEFENALVSDGAKRLLAILSRKVTVGTWAVGLLPTGDDLCTTLVVPGECVIAEPTTPLPDTSVFKNLTVSTPDTGPDATKLVLKGTATAGGSDSIASVRTLLFVCNVPTTPPSSCTGGGSTFSESVMTLAQLGTPVSVSAGQSIDVTVRISFS